MSLITVPQIRKLMQTPPEDDELLQDDRDAVVALWEDRTCRLWERRAGYEYHTQAMGFRTNILWLPLWPVESIASVDWIDALGATDTIDAGNYHLRGDNQLVHENGPWAQFPEIVVTLTGGYTYGATAGQAETPAFVRKALLLQLQFEKARFQGERVITRSQNFEGGSGVFEKADLHPYFASQAKRHRVKRPG